MHGVLCVLSCALQRARDMAQSVPRQASQAETPMDQGMQRDAEFSQPAQSGRRLSTPVVSRNKARSSQLPFVPLLVLADGTISPSLTSS
jgi:hypothetical protein